MVDIATYPWIDVAVRQDPEQLEIRPCLKRWYVAIHQRPAVVRAMALMAENANPSVKPTLKKRTNRDDYDSAANHFLAALSV